MSPVTPHRMTLQIATGGSRKPDGDAGARCRQRRIADQQPRKPGVRLVRERVQGADLREEAGPLLGCGTAGAMAPAYLSGVAALGSSPATDAA